VVEVMPQSGGSNPYGGYLGDYVRVAHWQLTVFESCSEHAKEQKMKPKAEVHSLLKPPSIWKLAGLLILLCSSRLYAQSVDLQVVVDAKAAAARAARMHAAPDITSATATGTFITFDAPGSVNGTFPAGISNGGDITGYYYDANFTGHGFLREKNGTLVAFDVPGAVNGTYPSGINDSGAITGGYLDNLFLEHGFVLAVNGALSTFDAPGSVNGTFGVAINPAGSITGAYSDANFALHGFLRDKKGGLVTFDAPGATVFGTLPDSITPNGSILGIYTNFFFFGFQRAASGAISTITGPGGLGGQLDPLNAGPPISINPKGTIAGTYFQPIAGNPFGGNYQVFVLSAGGTYVTFVAANYPPCCIWSAPSGISPNGTIVGSFNDGFDINHGFLRTSHGNLTTFDVPGAGTGNFQGTLPVGITPGGTIAGWYVDPTGLAHGFLFTPQGGE